MTPVFCFRYIYTIFFTDALITFIHVRPIIDIEEDSIHGIVDCVIRITKNAHCSFLNLENTVKTIILPSHQYGQARSIGV